MEVLEIPLTEVSKFRRVHILDHRPNDSRLHIEFYRRSRNVRMFTKIVAIALFCVARASVHRADNDTETSHDFARKCCFGSIDAVENRYNPNHSNHTSATISYDKLGNIADMCCTTCVENTFESETGRQRSVGANKQERSKVDARTDTKLFCHKACYSNDRTLQRFNEWNYSESAEVNGSSTKNYDCHPGKAKSRSRTCDSLFTSLNFWGANIVIFANIVYVVPYSIVVLVYLAVPGSGVRAYNKAVICYNASQIILNGILIGLGGCVLCHVPMHPNAYVYSGLAIMFLTISSTFWLFVIRIDTTLVITRFRVSTSTDANKRQERKKFLTYAIWTWGGSLLPTILACIAELSPLLPKSSPIRPNFQKFQDGANLAVIIYVATFPALTCLANTILFCYTSFRMILIQKSTTLATANNSNATINGAARKRYILFLRLYPLMDAPWISSALAAAFSDLWVLKFLRMVQPILMLLAILPPRTLSRIFACSHRFQD